MRRLRAVALAAVAASALLAAPLARAADEIEIISAEVDADRAGTIEISMPAEYATSIDVGAATSLTENGTSLPVTVEQVPTRGLEIALVIDTSGSMNEGNAMGAAKAAAIGFLEALPPEVKVGVISFADGVSVGAAMSTDRALTRAAINNLDASGETAMYDAILNAELLFSGPGADRQILLLSDGGDTVSGADLARATELTTRIRTSVITLVSSEADLGALQALAAAGGGNVASADDPSALAALYQEAADDLLYRYRIAFTAVASGDVTYVVAVSTPDGVLQAQTTVPVAAPPTTTVTTPSTSTEPSSPGATTPATTIPAATPDGGSSNGTLLLIGAVAVFLALVILLLVTLLAPRAERAAQTLRARRSTTAIAPADSPGVVSRASDLAESFLARRGRARSLAGDLEVAGLPLRPGEFMLIALVGGVALILLLAALVPPLIGVVLGALLTPFIAAQVLRSKIERRRRAFVEQLPDVLQSMVSSLRAGYGLPQSLDLAANQAADPARAELQRVLFEVRVGRDVSEALGAAAERMKSPDFSWVVAAMQINREVGGELSGVLEKVAETVRDRQRLRRQIQVLTAEGRLSAYILIALPILLAAYMVVTQPGYYEPFGETPGIFLPFIGLALLGVGWFWMRRIVRSDP